MRIIFPLVPIEFEITARTRTQPFRFGVRSLMIAVAAIGIVVYLLLPLSTADQQLISQVRLESMAVEAHHRKWRTGRHRSAERPEAIFVPKICVKRSSFSRSFTALHRRALSQPAGNQLSVGAWSNRRYFRLRDSGQGDRRRDSAEAKSGLGAGNHAGRHDRFALCGAIGAPRCRRDSPALSCRRECTG